MNTLREALNLLASIEVAVGTHTERNESLLLFTNY